MFVPQHIERFILRYLIVRNLQTLSHNTNSVLSSYQNSRVLSVKQGVQCFDHSKQLNLLVTGAPDHMLRLWNPYVPNKPITVLEGHYSAIVDVVIYEYLEQVFSYSADAVSLLNTEALCCMTMLVLRKSFARIKSYMYLL